MLFRDRIDALRTARQVALTNEPLDCCGAGAPRKGAGAEKVLKEKSATGKSKPKRKAAR